MNKYKLLSQYTLSDSKVVPVKREKKLDGILIPQYWSELLNEPNMTQKKQIVFNEWKKYVAEELRTTIQYLESFLEEIEVIRVENDVYLLYTITSYQTEQKLYYVGGNPLNSHKSITKGLVDKWMRLPVGLRDFYDNLHDGFYAFAGQAMGLDKTFNIMNFDNFEMPGELEGIINFENTYNFFSTGEGSYVALDLSNEGQAKTMIWLNGEEPILHLKFWDAVNEYYYISFDI